MNEAFENGHVDGTVQTAAYFKSIINTNDSTITELQEKLDALQEERLDLVGKLDRSEESYKELEASSKAECKAMVEAVEREAAGRIEAMKAERDQALADLDDLTDPWKAWVASEHGIPDQPHQCPKCERTYSIPNPVSRLLCCYCYDDEYKTFQAVLEDVEREFDGAREAFEREQEAEASEVESEDAVPESPAKRQCLSGTQIHELD